MVSIATRNSGMSYVLAIEGLDELAERLGATEKQIDSWLSKAVNRTTTRYRTEASRAMREQIAFGARYLISGQGGRLTIPRKATPNSPEATIRGRFDPTSLATFVKGVKRHGRRSPTLEVSTGRRTQIDRSFLMNLANGNLGLALRLRPGETIQNKRTMARRFSSKDRNLYLLYGPSVDQVFRSVREDIAPDAGDFLEKEFLRLAEALI